MQLINAMPRPDLPPRKLTCRKLFGDVDHEQNTRDMEQECSSLLESKSRLWNFDFRNHQLMEGDGIEWQPVITTTSNDHVTTFPVASDEVSMPEDKQTVEEKETTDEQDECQIIKIVNASPIRPPHIASPSKSVRFSEITIIHGKRRRYHQQTIHDYMKKTKPRSALDLTFRKEPIASRLRSSPQQIPV